MPSDIVIRGAREHNLQNIDLRLPRNKLICMTGVSGSGKSSLAFDTLYAEGQRRYVESLSSYARQFLGQMPKPEVDAVSGLAPSISIQQKTAGRNPRSTVATITEIYDYLRVLFARVGKGHCPSCGRPITAQTAEQIIDGIAALPEGTRFAVLAPLIQQQKGEYRDLFEDLLKRGYLRARVDGRLVELDADLRLDRQMKHTIEVVIDRLVAGKTSRSRLAEAVEQALRQSGGTLIVSFAAAQRAARDEQDDERLTLNDQLYSARYACTHCQLGFEPPSPQLFSFNSPQGMCLDCNGLGRRHDFVIERLVPDDRLSIAKGALELLGPLRSVGRWRRHIFEGVAAAIEHDLGLDSDSLLTTPWRELPGDAKQRFLYGAGDRHITFAWRHSGGVWKHGGTWDGYVADLLAGYRKAKNPMRRRQLEKHMEFNVCTTCRGTRLNAQARAVRISSISAAARDRAVASLSLPEVCALTIRDAARFFEQIDLDHTGRLIAEEALKEICGRLGFLIRCGLDYLTLDRTAPTLSGGEAQRIRLAGQIGCGLVGVVYILDEPSIGLHPRDNELLLASLCELRDQGNTVIVVEHDEDTMRAADHIVDFGPGPGVRGGEIVAQGTLSQIEKEKRSLTGRFLSGKQSIPVPETRRQPGRQWLAVKGARHNNLQDIDVRFPLGTFLCVTGVSGSGKSSLVNDILWNVLNRELNKGKGRPGRHKRVTGLQHLDKAIDIDQSPIGRTPRSNPATYVKLFDEIRRLYTHLPEAKARGYKPGRFSFNVPGGRCEACEGHGSNKLGMDFLADVWVTCPVCEGRRFNRETLEIRYKGRSIAEVLDMDVQEALEHFENIPKIKTLLDTLHGVGLDYLKLGQPSPTLSGGEAQRIKLARELGKRSTGRTIYLLDEPTTGLHFADIQKLLEVLHGFVNAGNTVLVVEHNLDVIKTADWIIDLGPEGGEDGGTVVIAGTPEDVAACEASYTGAALRRVLSSVEGRNGRRTGPKAIDRPLAGNGRVRATSTTHRAPRTTHQIVIRGARQHNLQNLDLTIPREKISVFCGPSGSGKSSLAMDTLYAEGQRRYVESLSAYARQFLGQMPKPKVEHIHGLSPAIAIEQKTTGSTPRSTVGTVTEIYDYLRILYARLGTPYCPDCDIPIATQTTDQVIDKLLALPDGTKLLVLAPQEIRVGQKYEDLWERLRADGFLRVRIDGTTYRLDDVTDMDRRRKHEVDIVVDRVTVGRQGRSRLADSVEAAIDLGRGTIRVAHVDDPRPEPGWRVDRYSLFYACGRCGRSFDELNPHNFSFNSPLGWCHACEGLGTEKGTDVSALITDPRRSLRDGAVAAWPDAATSSMFTAMLDALAAECGIPLDLPYDQLDPKQQRMVLYGAGDRWFEVGSAAIQGAARQPDERERSTSNVERSTFNEDAPRIGDNPRPLSLHAHPSSLTLPFRFQYKGLYPAIEEASRVSYVYRQRFYELIGEVPCSVCSGSRLRTDAAAVRFQGKTLQQLCSLPLDETLALLKRTKFDASERRVAGDLLNEATGRLSFLVDVGLEYITLSRPLPTLSGGETQRIRLAGQVGRALTGVLYVLDEPTIGLHPRDNNRLLAALARLRDLGNTVVLVEHDREVLDAADRLYDFGPGAGRFGGTITAEGTPKQISRQTPSLTGQFLSRRREIVIPERRRMESAPDPSPASHSPTMLPPTPAGGWLELLGCRQNNLKNVDLRIPLGALTCVTGVSGSGKSSLVEDTLARAVARKLHRAGEAPAPHDELRGLEQVNKIIVVDQQPLGSTPASNPATYTGVFDEIRELFARLPEAKVRGYRPARFSFNRAGGRCDDCDGNGQKCIEMHFLPDVWVECDTCRGRRYNTETLAVTYRGRSIADVLELPIGQARELFDNIPKIRAYLETLCAIGLDYLTLGQPAPTLSGGEAQRVKLAAELARPQTGKTLYLLDEPTTGLHFDDIDKLLKVLGSLVEAGNTVVVVEHNLDVIKTADWVIDLGPEAGSAGGWIVAEGTPEDVVRIAATYSNDRSATAPRAACSPDEYEHSTLNVRHSTVNATSSPGPWMLDPRPFRSYTGELLAPVLAGGKRAERDVFDAKAARRKRAGDLDLKQVGRQTKMPWQTDGRRWHVKDRIAHNGNACRWEGAALELVIDELEHAGGFAPPNWNHRSIVEIVPTSKQGGWFLHAQSGDEWLLTLKFRVKKNSFREVDLRERLALKPWDDIDELPIYGRAGRVRIKNLKGAWQEITVTVHWRREIDTPEFQRFLEEAREAFFAQAHTAKLNPDDLTPWKVLGRKWHLSRKGFPSGKRVRWEPDVLERLLDAVEQAWPQAEFDYGSKSVINIRRGNGASLAASIHTKRRAGVELAWYVSSGSVALGRIAEFGSSRAIDNHRDGRDVVKIRFVKGEQVTAAALRELLADQSQPS